MKSALILLTPMFFLTWQDDNASEMFVRIQEAKEVLLCQKRRTDYDRNLANENGGGV
jgi:DnaJ-class molecular chaperone